MIIRNDQLNHLHERRRRAGFTLMEILIVVAIIVILASLGGVAVMNQYKGSQVSTAILKARSIGSAVKQFYIDNNRYPNDLNELLVKNDVGKGPYLTNQTDILDPWGQTYQYDAGGNQSRANGVLDGSPDVFTTAGDGSGRVIGNWSTK